MDRKRKSKISAAVAVLGGVSVVVIFAVMVTLLCLIILSPALLLPISNWG